MSIFHSNVKPIKENNNQDVVLEHFDASLTPERADGSFTGLQSILSESSYESYRLLGGMYISDIAIEESVLEGSQDVEILTESLVKSSWNKLTKIISALWAKIRAWFESSKKYITTFVASGEKLIKEYGSELKEKASDGFKYSGYVYDLDKGTADVSAKLGVIMKFIDKKIGVDGSAGSDYADKQEDRNKKTKGADTSDDTKEQLFDKLGVSSTDELVKSVTAAFRPNPSGEIVDFSGKKNDIITFLQNGSAVIAKSTENSKTNDAMFNRVLAAIKASEAAASKLDGAAAAKYTAAAQHRYSVAQFALTLTNQLFGVHVRELTDAYKQDLAAMRSFLRYKGTAKTATAGAVTENLDPAQSLLEMSSKYL